MHSVQVLIKNDMHNKKNILSVGVKMVGISLILFTYLLVPIETEETETNNPRRTKRDKSRMETKTQC